MVGMGEHLHPLILTQIERRLTIHGLRLVVLQIPHHHLERLLIILYELGLRGVGGATDTWGQYVVHRRLVVVLLDIHGTHLHRATFCRRGAQTMLIHAPLTTHEVQTAETQHDRFLETRHEHTHETDAGEVVDAALLMLVLYQRDTELIPVHTRGVAITQFHTAGSHIGDEAVIGCRAVTEGFEDLRTDAHLILIIALKLIEGIVAIDVFHIGAALVTGVVGFLLVIRIRRVALGVVDQFVTVENALLLVIVIRTAEIVIVIASRVVAPRLDHAVVGHDACTDHSIHPLLIGAVIALLGIRQAIESHILQLARAARSGKGVSLRGLYGNLTPLGGDKRARAVDGHAALIELLTVAEDILAHLAQIDVEVAAIVGSRTFLAGIDKGIEHPELDILDVGLLEVGGFQPAHHSAPFCLGLSQGAVAVEVACQIVRATLLRVICQVQHGKR